MNDRSTMSATSQDIYATLGYLFYSVAACDGRVPPAEAQKLKTEVMHHWLPAEKSRDEFGTDVAYYIEFGFDEALRQNMSADEAFAQFQTFHEANPQRFQASERQRIFRTAAAIANAVAGNNKSELVRLAQLESLFKK